MLINCRYAVLLGHQRIRHDDSFPVQDNLTAIRLVNSCQCLNKSGFSRSVFPDDCMNFALFQVEAHIVQCLHTREDLRNMVHLQQVFRHLHHSLIVSLSRISDVGYYSDLNNNAICRSCQ